MQRQGPSVRTIRSRRSRHFTRPRPLPFPLAAAAAPAPRTLPRLIRVDRGAGVLSSLSPSSSSSFSLSSASSAPSASSAEPSVGATDPAFLADRRVVVLAGVACAGFARPALAAPLGVSFAPPFALPFGARAPRPAEGVGTSLGGSTLKLGVNRTGGASSAIISSGKAGGDEFRLSASAANRCAHFIAANSSSGKRNSWLWILFAASLYISTSSSSRSCSSPSSLPSESSGDKSDSWRAFSRSSSASKSYRVCNLRQSPAGRVCGLRGWM